MKICFHNLRDIKIRLHDVRDIFNKLNPRISPRKILTKTDCYPRLFTSYLNKEDHGFTHIRSQQKITVKISELLIFLQQAQLIFEIRIFKNNLNLPRGKLMNVTIYFSAKEPIYLLYKRGRLAEEKQIYIIEKEL